MASGVRISSSTNSSKWPPKVPGNDVFSANSCSVPKLATLPLFRFDQWKANLRILEVSEIKTVPYVPVSHPFVERLIGTIRREYLDRTLFWTTADLENKLLDFQTYFNEHRAHTGGKGERRNKTRGCRGQAPISIPMDGNATAEAFITRQWLPDSPKTPAPSGTRRTSARKPQFERKPFAIGACKRGAVGLALGHIGCIPQPWLASTGQRLLLPKITQNINSLGTSNEGTNERRRE